jgi:adenylylsulfate kinase
MKKTTVLWFTGLSGSGKSTIAGRFARILKKEGKKVLMLDDDVVRNTLHRHLGFTPEDIRENNELIARMCSDNLGKFDYILVPIISPFADSRKKARELLAGSFFEIYTKASLDVVIKRDVKGLYSRALKGEISNFIGISPEVPYEDPQNPDVVLETDKEELDISVRKLQIFFNPKEKANIK